MPLYLGIDIGGTKIAAGLVTDAGHVLSRTERPTEAQAGGRRILANALNLAQASLTEATERVQGIGIGTGGQVDAARGVIVSATEILPGWAGTDVKGAFEEAFGMPAAVDNDVNALAIGEFRFGAARQYKTVIFLALGTGVGGALLFNGRLHHGAHWSGAEFGQILLDTHERRTLESYVSGPGLVRTWRELTGNTDTTITGHEIAAPAASDPHGETGKAIARTGDYLGYGLVSLANALDPDLIVIGGGLAALGDRLLDPARHILKRYALPGPATCSIVKAALGADAAVVGAATLAMSSL